MLKKSDANKQAYWLVVNGSEIWLDAGTIPFGTAQSLDLPSERAVEIACYHNNPVYWLNDADIERELEMSSLRTLLYLPQELFLIASKAVQYGYMNQTMRFCGQCGGRCSLNHSQLAMQCHECRELHYPRIYPCIIVAIRKGSQVLLAQHSRHKNNMYTVIAGFLEVGETLEECVAREVEEETGIKIKNIQYFGSQPWAFPSSMMVGFVAEYAGGEIQPDHNELSDAAWFEYDNLPEIPPTGTIARALIESVVGIGS